MISLFFYPETSISPVDVFKINIPSLGEDLATDIRKLQNSHFLVVDIESDDTDLIYFFIGVSCASGIPILCITEEKKLNPCIDCYKMKVNYHVEPKQLEKYFKAFEKALRRNKNVFDCLRDEYQTRDKKEYHSSVCTVVLAIANTLETLIRWKVAGKNKGLHGVA